MASREISCDPYPKGRDSIHQQPNFHRKDSDIVATCVVCSTQNAPWSLWCVRCRAHLTHPNAGRLASPGRRLAAEVLELVVVVVMVLISYAVAESLASPKTLATT